MSLQDYIQAYDAYFRLARKIAYDILRDHDLAGDVAQELFTELFQKKEQLDSDLIKYWIVIHANRRAIDCQRRPCRRRETDFFTLELPNLACPVEAETLVLRREQIYYRFSALEALKNHNKDWYDILIRYHVHDESYNSMAKSYGMTAENLRKQVSRARKWLSEKVRELYEE